MKKIAFIIFILAHFVLSAQNLVPNGDFETYTNCPTSAGSQIYFASPWTGAPNNSVDYYNSCNTSNNSVPHQYNNHQQAHSGQAFVGCFFMNGVNSYREYPQVQLTSTLINGNYYHAKFYVNKVANTYYATNNISGAFRSAFTPTNSTSTFSNVLSYSVNVQKFGNPIIKDTLNWIKIETIYQASGTENYFLIGNFKYDYQTDTFSLNDGSFGGTYYFIDDVSIENITTPQWQYRDTTIYLGDSVLIGPAITGLNVDWFDMSNTFIKNAPGIYVKPIVTTPYQTTETFNSVVYNHTVTVTVLLPTKVDEYEKLQNSFVVYPNPAKDKIYIESKEVKEFNIKLLDVLGREILSKENETEINLHDLNKGIYFLRLYKEESLLCTKKLIKE